MTAATDIDTTATTTAKHFIGSAPFSGVPPHVQIMCCARSGMRGPMGALSVKAPAASILASRRCKNGLVDCGLFLDGQIDALALGLGERQPLRAEPQVREEFRVVPLPVLHVVDCGNQILPGRQSLDRELAVLIRPCRADGP